MEKLIFDTGIKEYAVNENGVLRFNPTDQNVYARFMEFYKELGTLSKEYDEAVEKYQAENPSAKIEMDEKGFDAVAELAEVSRKTDKAFKERLAYVFGSVNDFDRLFDGINIMAMTDTGYKVIENFLTALLPIIESNAEKRKAVMDAKVKEAVKNAELNRSQRRAIAHGKVDASGNG